MLAKDLPNGYCFNQNYRVYAIKHNDMMYFYNGFSGSVDACIQQYVPF